MEFPTSRNTPKLLERVGKICYGQWTNAYDRAIRHCVGTVFPPQHDTQDEHLKQHENEVPTNSQSVDVQDQANILIPNELFDDIVDVLRNRRYLEKSEALQEQESWDLRAYERRLRYVIDRNAQATSWMSTTREPESVAETLRQLGIRQRRYEEASEKLKSHIDRREIFLEQAWNEWNTKFDILLEDLSAFRNGNNFCRLVDPSVINIELPIEDAELDEDEEDCQTFARLIAKESGQRCREDDEWEWAQTRLVEQKRRELDEVRQKIFDLEERPSKDSEDHESHSLVQARERVVQIECQLQETLEVVWDFTNDYNSNGSFIGESIGSCSIPVLEELENVDPEPEITEEEYDAMQSKTTEAVQKWQHAVDAKMGPEEAGPPSPQSTDEFSFQDEEADVEAEDSLSQAGGLIDPRLPKIHKGKQVREIIDAWVAENERIRNSLDLENELTTQAEGEDGAEGAEVGSFEVKPSGGDLTKSNLTASRCSDDMDDDIRMLAPEAKRAKTQL